MTNSVCCLKVSLDGQTQKTPHSVVFRRKEKFCNTRLWSMMNALCQINRNVRKKTNTYSYLHISTAAA